MTHQETLIMDAQAIEATINRMAHEIYEENFSEKAIVFVGIQKRGMLLAERLAERLRQISPMEVSTFALNLKKREAHVEAAAFQGNLADLKGNTVLLVDDVINSGMTLFFGLSPFMPANLKSLQIAVLVHRSYLRFPVMVNYIGTKVATTPHEHVAVNLTFDKEEKVILR